jgi:hypothetical protein
VKIALKEWAAVIRALELGRQIFLLRKGGLAETSLGFELAHPEFVFYPTWEHQQREQLQPEFQTWFDELKPGDPERLRITAFAEAAEVLDAPADRGRWSQARDLHIWSDDYIDMRYDYRPELPLRIVLLRGSRLHTPVEIPVTRRYSGCRSWVELDADIPLHSAAPALSETDFLTAKKRLCNALEIDPICAEH